MPDPCIPSTQRVPWATTMSSFAHMVTIYRNAWHFSIRYDSPRMASIAVRATCRTIIPLIVTCTGAGGSSHRQRTRLDDSPPTDGPPIIQHCTVTLSVHQYRVPYSRVHTYFTRLLARICTACAPRLAGIRSGITWACCTATLRGYNSLSSGLSACPGSRRAAETPGRWRPRSRRPLR